MVIFQYYVSILLILSHIVYYTIRWRTDMKKKDIVNLIRYYVENNDTAFRENAYMIADDFNRSGDIQLGSYIYSLLSESNTFVPQNMLDNSQFLYKIDVINKPLPLPSAIYEDITGIVNAMSYDASINKFLFAGAPGTGKTESAKQLARILGRELYAVSIENLIDSRLGQTAKNITALFNEISNLYAPERVLILFDEIDALALRRTDSHDMREMGRATTSVLKGFDNLISSVVIVATTNLMDQFDRALLRRFDKIVDFNRYTNEDLIEIADTILDSLLSKFSFAQKNTRLFNKILKLRKPVPYPGELWNIIRSSIAFSNPGDGYDYFRRFLKQISPEHADNINALKKEGFTLREIEILSSVSKSTLSRLFKEDKVK